VTPLAELLPKCRTGILFSGPLVLAILAGKKTVTRRMDEAWLRLEPGDLLYVRETIRREGTRVSPASGEEFDRALYAADGSLTKLDTWPWERGVLPSIHMPRGLARIVLRVTESPWQEPVQDITQEDALGEGVERGPACDASCTTPHRCGFIDVWHRLHTKPGERWQDNPEVVRIAFERAA
jgi:hypothetical protein